MKNEVAAKPYARAVFALATADHKEEQVAQELGQVLMTWDGDREFRQFIRRPEVPAKAKREAIRRVFQDVGQMTSHLLDVVIDKNREDILATIYEEYRNLWDESRGILHAEVTSAETLSEAQQESLAKSLGEATGRTVKVTTKRDQSLMAGIVIRMGDRVLDGSLARRLAVLGDRLRSGDGGGSVVEH